MDSWVWCTKGVLKNTPQWCRALVGLETASPLELQQVEVVFFGYIMAMDDGNVI